MNFKNLLSKLFEKNLFTLLLIIVIGLYFRLTGIEKGGLWIDEAASFTAASKSIPFGILEHLQNNDNHAPLYIFFLNIWIKIFGTNEIILRLPSVIFGILTILISYITGRKFLNNEAGLTLAFLVSINSTLIYYSQEVRSYSLIALLCTLSIFFLLNLKEKFSTQNNLTLAFTNLLILYTSTLGIIYVGTMLLVFFIYLIKVNKNYLFKFTALQSLAIFLYLPYLPIWLEHSHIYGNILFMSLWEKTDISLFTFDLIRNIFTPFSFIKLVYLKQAGESFFILFALIFLAIPLLIQIFAIMKNLKNFQSIICIYISVIFSTILILLGIFKNLPLNTRYFIFIIPALLFCCASGLQSINNKFFKKVLITTLILINLLYLIFIPFSAQHQPRLSRFYTETAEYVKNNNVKAEALIILPYGVYLEQDYYKNLGINAKIIKFDNFHHIPRKNSEYLKLYFPGNFLSQTNNLSDKSIYKDLRNLLYEKLYSPYNKAADYLKFKSFIKTNIENKLKGCNSFVVSIKKYNYYNKEDYLKYKDKPNLFNKVSLWTVLNKLATENFIKYFDEKYQLIDEFESDTTLLKVYQVKHFQE